MMKKNNFLGFTLLELLVVIGIIGIIMALATVAYSATQKGGRDARRRQDLSAIQNALEQYYSTNGYVYPDTDCTEAKNYLKGSWPIDPGTTSPYSGASVCTDISYCICAQMEAGRAGNSVSTECDFTSPGDKNYYCVGNLQ